MQLVQADAALQECNDDFSLRLALPCWVGFELVGDFFGWTWKFSRLCGVPTAVGFALVLLIVSARLWSDLC